MSNEAINIILWILAWVAIASLKNNLDISRRAMAGQLKLNKIQQNINRELVKEIKLLRDIYKFE